MEEGEDGGSAGGGMMNTAEVKDFVGVATNNSFVVGGEA